MAIILNEKMLQAICMQLAANIESGRSPFMTGTSQRLHSLARNTMHCQAPWILTPPPISAGHLAKRVKTLEEKGSHKLLTSPFVTYKHLLELDAKFSITFLSVHSNFACVVLWALLRQSKLDDECLQFYLYLLFIFAFYLLFSQTIRPLIVIPVIG